MIQDLRPQAYLIHKLSSEQQHSLKQQQTTPLPKSHAPQKRGSHQICSSKPTQTQAQPFHKGHQESIHSYRAAQMQYTGGSARQQHWHSPSPRPGNSSPQRYINNQIIIDRAHRLAMREQKRLSLAKDENLERSSEVKELAVQQLLTKDRLRAGQQIYDGIAKKIQSNTNHSEKMYTVLSNSNEASESLGTRTANRRQHP